MYHILHSDLLCNDTCSVTGGYIPYGGWGTNGKDSKNHITQVEVPDPSRIRPDRNKQTRGVVRTKVHDQETRMNAYKSEQGHYFFSLFEETNTYKVTSTPEYPRRAEIQLSQ